MGIGHWLLGIGLGCWILGLGSASADPQSPMPNAQSPMTVRQTVRLSIDPGAPVTACSFDRGPAAPIVALAFGPGGKLLACNGYHEVLVWDLSAGRLAQRAPAAEVGSIQAIAFDKSGSTLLVAGGKPGQSGLVRMIGVESGLASSLAAGNDLLLSIALSPDGKLLAAGSADRQVYVWNLADRKLLTTLSVNTDAVEAVAFSPDGELLAAGSADRTVRVWQVAGWSPLETLPQPDAVHAVAFSPDSEFVAAAVGSTENKQVRIRRVPEKVAKVVAPPASQPGATQPANTKPPARPAGGRVDRQLQYRTVETGAALGLAMAWSGDGKIYVACSDGVIRSWSAQTTPVNQPVSLTQNPPLAGNQDWVYSLALSPDGTRVASGSADGMVRLWAAPARPLATVVQIAPSSDQWAIVSSRGVFAASAETANSKALRWEFSTPTSQPDQVIARLADSKRLCVLLNEKPAAPAAPTPSPAPVPPKAGGPAKPAGPGPATRPNTNARNSPTSKPDATSPPKKAN